MLGISGKGGGINAFVVSWMGDRFDGLEAARGVRCMEKHVLAAGTNLRALSRNVGNRFLYFIRLGKMRRLRTVEELIIIVMWFGNAWSGTPPRLIVIGRWTW